MVLGCFEVNHCLISYYDIHTSIIYVFEDFIFENISISLVMYYTTPFTKKNTKHNQNKIYL